MKHGKIKLDDLGNGEQRKDATASLPPNTATPEDIQARWLAARKKRPGQEDPRG